MSKRLQTTLTGSDWFCGAGGSSEGATWAGLEMRAAANHWKLAIETHNTNHPDTDHFLTNLSQADPKYFPRTNILIASPECTSHSLAKGHKRKSQAQLSMFDPAKLDPAEERSRATMWCVPRFAEYHDYDVIIVENVVDIHHWRTWPAWLHAMDLLGYNYHLCYFNSMFFNPINGLKDYAPQSRDRIYIVFWKKGNKRPDLDFRPLAWCSTCETDIQAIQSWKNTRKRWGRYGKLAQYLYRCPGCAGEVEPYYYASWNCIDWSIEAPRIGDRAQPLKENTLRRIQIGLEKYGKQPILVQTDRSYAKNNRSFTLLQPMPTQTTRQNLGFIVRMKGDISASAKGFDEPLPALTTVAAPYLIELHGTGTAKGIDEALPCILAGGNHHGLIMPQPFLSAYYSRDNAQSGIAEPMPTASTENRFGVVIPHGFLTGLFGPQGQKINFSLEQQLPSTTTTPGYALVMPQPFFANYYGKSGATGVGDAMPTVTTTDHFGLTIPDEKLRVEDCGFRMLQPHEVKDGMGFGPDYVLLGTKREQVKLSGNAVTPPVMQWLTRQCMATFE